MSKQWSSFDKSKLMMENWRKFIQEEEGSSNMGDADELMKLNLSSFIDQVQLKPNQAAILNGLADGDDDDDKFIVKSVVVTCRDLRPTQNEVVMSKSLEYPLVHAGDFIKYTSSNGPFKVGPPGNDAIITFGGKYVIDGHHRWSALYCCNPDAQLYAFNISKPGESADDVLKAAQAAIMYALGRIPANKGGGINLFEVDEKTVLKYVHSVLSKHPKSAMVIHDYLEERGTLKEFKQMGGALVYQPLTKKIIWPNIEVLKSESPPMKNATARPLMPQTDKVGKVTAGGELPKALEPLVKGRVNTEKPFRKGRDMKGINLGRYKSKKAAE